MDDQQLLELAARAAGIEVWRGSGHQSGMLFRSPSKADPSGKVTGVEWNPRDDDGDAFRLACDLRIDTDWSHSMRWERDKEVQAYSRSDDDASTATYSEPHVGDSDSRRIAARRAITRAAAEIGKALAGEDAGR